MTDVKVAVPPTYQNNNGAHFKSCALVGTSYIFILKLVFVVDRNSVVSLATLYGLNGPRIES
jgi:hypothetical protein